MKMLMFLLLLTSWGVIAQAASQDQILGYYSNSNGVHVQVTSGGCTTKNSFTKQMSTQSNDIIRISFSRVKPDNCLGRFYYGTMLNYSFAELGLKVGDRFEITNRTGMHEVAP